MAIVTAIPGTAFPGTALIGQATPGYLGPSAPPTPTPGGIAVGTTPVLLASSAPAADMLVPSGTCYLTNGSTAVYLGGTASVNTSNGLQLAANASQGIPLFPSDQVWACTASGTSTVHVTQTGS